MEERAKFILRRKTSIYPETTDRVLKTDEQSWGDGRKIEKSEKGAVFQTMKKSKGKREGTQ